MCLLFFPVHYFFHGVFYLDSGGSSLDLVNTDYKKCKAALINRYPVLGIFWATYLPGRNGGDFDILKGSG